MAYWLFKEEPEHYSFADLERDGRTVWSGVANHCALRHLGKVCRGDQILYYHTGKEKAVVGIVQAESDAYPDPSQKDTRLVVVDVKPLRRLARPVTLKQIKEDKAFAGWELVRIARLSVMPVSAGQWKRIEELAKG